MKIEIKNTGDLINFIKLDSTTYQQAEKVVSVALKVIIVSKYTKQQLIEETELHINKYLTEHPLEIPIFLGLDLSVI